MKRPFPFVFFLAFIFFAGCSKIDGDRCVQSRKITESWNATDAFVPVFDLYQPEEQLAFGVEGYVLYLTLGTEEGGLIYLEDVCSEDLLRVSAQIQLKPEGVEWVRKAQLVVTQLSEGAKVNRTAEFAGVGEQAELSVDFWEVAPLSGHTTPGLGRNTLVTVYLYPYGLSCDEAEAGYQASLWLNQVVETAEVSVSYTQY